LPSKGQPQFLKNTFILNGAKLSVQISNALNIQTFSHLGNNFFLASWDNLILRVFLLPVEMYLLAFLTS